MNFKNRKRGYSVAFPWDRERLTELGYDQAERNSACHGLLAVDDIKLLCGILQMENNGSLRNAEYLRSFPSGFSFRRPQQALLFPVSESSLFQGENLYTEDFSHGFVQMRAKQVSDR